MNDVDILVIHDEEIISCENMSQKLIEKALKKRPDLAKSDILKNNIVRKSESIEFVTIQKLIAEAQANIDIITPAPYSSVPIAGTFIILVKRLIRKSIFWFVRACFEQQISFNNRTLGIEAENIRLMQIMKAEMDQLKYTISRLEEQLKSTESGDKK